MNAATNNTVVPTAAGAANLTKINAQQGANNNVRLDTFRSQLALSDLPTASPAGTTPRFDFSSGRGAAGLCLALSGAEYVSATSGTAVNGGTSANFPSVTPPVDDCWLIGIMSTVGTTSGTSYSVTTSATGWTADGGRLNSVSTARSGIFTFIRKLGTGTAGMATGTANVASVGGVSLRWLPLVVLFKPSTGTFIASGGSWTAATVQQFDGLLLNTRTTIQL